MDPWKAGPRFGQKARYRAPTDEYVLSGIEMHRFWERENEQADRIVALEKRVRRLGNGEVLR